MQLHYLLKVGLLGIIASIHPCLLRLNLKHLGRHSYVTMLDHCCLFPLQDSIAFPGLNHALILYLSLLLRDFWGGRSGKE
jgi:hypothetical protein